MDNDIDFFKRLIEKNYDPNQPNKSTSVIFMKCNIFHLWLKRLVLYYQETIIQNIQTNQLFQKSIKKSSISFADIKMKV